MLVLMARKTISAIVEKQFLARPKIKQLLLLLVSVDLFSQIR